MFSWTFRSFMWLQIFALEAFSNFRKYHQQLEEKCIKFQIRWDKALHYSHWNFQGEILAVWFQEGLAPTDTNNPVSESLVDCLKQLKTNFPTAISFRNEVWPIDLLTRDRPKEQSMAPKTNFPQNLANIWVWFSDLFSDSWKWDTKLDVWIWYILANACFIAS